MASRCEEGKVGSMGHEVRFLRVGGADVPDWICCSFKND